MKNIDINVLSELCKIQCTAEECAAVMGMSADTLNARLKELGFKGFRDYMAVHGAEGKASLRRQQWALAHEGNPTMLIWLGKNVLGQTDKVEEKIEQTSRVISESPEQTEDEWLKEHK